MAKPDQEALACWTTSAPTAIGVPASCTSCLQLDRWDPAVYLDLVPLNGNEVVEWRPAIAPKGTALHSGDAVAVTIDDPTWPYGTVIRGSVRSTRSTASLPSTARRPSVLR